MANGVVDTDLRELICRDAETLEQRRLLLLAQQNVLRDEEVLRDVHQQLILREEIQVEHGFELLAGLGMIAATRLHLSRIIRNLVLDDDHRRSNILLLHVLHQPTFDGFLCMYCFIAITPRLDELLKLTMTRSLLSDSFTPYSVKKQT